MRRLFNSARLRKVKLLKDAKLMERFGKAKDSMGGKVSRFDRLFPALKMDKGAISIFGDKNPKGFGRFNKGKKKKNTEKNESENNDENQGKKIF